MRQYAVCANAPICDNVLGWAEYPWVLFTYWRAGAWGRERLWAWPYRVDSLAGKERIMRVYAVLSGNPRDNIALAARGYPWVLNSFASTENLRAIDGVAVDPLTHVTSKGELTTAEGSPDYRPRGVLLDSGAFTVWTHGGSVDRDKLIEWSHDMRAHFGPDETRLINLDVIPGTKGGPQPTRRQVVRAVEQSIENAQAIREAGIPVIEVYHGREPLTDLDGILERRQPGELVAIGGMGGLSMPQKNDLCKRAFARIREASVSDDKLIPVHGLGLSGDSPLAARFPWFSCDATTWFTARNYNNHVKRDGRFQQRNRETSPRTTHDATQLFLRWRLDRWARFEQTLTDKWRRMGVDFDLGAAVPTA